MQFFKSEKNRDQRFHANVSDMLQEHAPTPQLLVCGLRLAFCATDQETREQSCNFILLLVISGSVLLLVCLLTFLYYNGTRTNENLRFYCVL